MASSRIFIPGFLLLVILQGCCWAQRQRLDASNPFEGVRYLSSRVASEPRSRSILNKTRPSWGGSYPTIIRTSSPTFSVPATTTTTTTTPRPIRYWQPTTATTTAPKPTRRPHWQETDFETIPSTPRMKIERVTGDTPGYLVTIEEERPWKSGFHGRYSPHVKPDRYSEAAVSSSEYRGIKEGSYYAQAGAQAPKESLGAVFDWDTARPHRHRHHHGGTTPAPLRYTDRSGGYEAFESRGASYSPAPTTRRPHRRLTTTLAPRETTTTRHRRQPQSSVAYHQRQNQRPASAVHRTSESVSYVSGSYFPISGGARKPATGFTTWHSRHLAPGATTPAPVTRYAARQPRPLAPVATTPAPVTRYAARQPRPLAPVATTSLRPLKPNNQPTTTTTTTSPILQHHYPLGAGRHEDDYDAEYDEAGARRHRPEDGRAKTRDEEDVWDDNVHPFAAYAGKS